MEPPACLFGTASRPGEPGSQQLQLPGCLCVVAPLCRVIQDPAQHGRVLYRWSDIDAYLDGNTREKTWKPRTGSMYNRVGDR
jgi:hypothetical protein